MYVKKKAEDSLTMLDVSDYMSVSSKYFGLPEKYSHDILAEKGTYEVLKLVALLMIVFQF